jgi:hypothetical protein
MEVTLDKMKEKVLSLKFYLLHQDISFVLLDKFSISQNWEKKNLDHVATVNLK